MQIEPTEADWAFAKSVHDEFSQKPGARYIAGEFALAYLSALLNKVKPRSALEFGAGIGTITHFLLKHPANIDHVTTTESNEFCLEQLAANIPEAYSDRYDLIADASTLEPGQRQYDLAVVDAYVGSQAYAHLDHGMTCFVEGTRTANHRELEDELAGRGLRCDFVNYNGGTKFLSIVLRRSRKSRIPYPKFRFRKVRKGCWIGTVETAV
jgi:hypothetical protein